MNVRFWIWNKEGPVKLTVPCDGSEIADSSSWPSDEGWGYMADRYWVEDGVLYHESSHGGRDCDGRIDYETVWRCPLADLKADTSYGEDNPRPLWERVSRSQRDEYAELAGY